MDDDGPVLTIGELARRAGLPVRTIRFWSDTRVLSGGPDRQREAIV
jgi:DNA-binding transcriptional MerR regulator